MTPICYVSIIAQKPCYLPFPDKDSKTLGAELKRRRLELEWTQADTAKHFGVLKDSYQKWEWNQITPDIRKRKIVSQFLTFNYWDDGTGSLANRVLLYRIKHQLTRMDLAKTIGVSDSTIERVEKSQGSISNSIRFGIEIAIDKSIGAIDEK